jgi:tRNA-binding protein
MIFHAFYNPEFVGDVLLVRLGEGKTTACSKVENITVLKNENQEIIGYNIFNASKYFSDLSVGLVKVTKELIDQCNALLNTYDLGTVTSDFADTFIVGKVLEMEKHPDSNHLHVCQVQLRNEITQIVCGASNVDKGQLVVVAMVGAVMPTGLIIKPSTLRKVPSNGMLCSARELGLSEGYNMDGIIVLDKKEYQVGNSFF